MKKRILALDQGEHIGGAEIFFSELLERISDQYDIHLVTGKNPLYLRRYSRSITVHSTDLPSLRPWRLKSYFKASKRLKEIIEYVQPDIMLSNTVRMHLLISPLSSRLRIPLIWFTHDTTFPRFLLPFFIRFPRTLLCCSEYVKKWYGRGEVVYPFAIDRRHIVRKEKKKIIGMIGKFIPWKGQDLFIQMAQQVSKSYPDYRFVIIGSPYEGNKASERYAVDCRRLIHSLNLTSVLEIKSSVSYILDEISGWDIFVHCSKKPEPLGRVILEGMSAGCAVIASKLGGPVEIVQHQRNGLLMDPTLESLVQAVELLLRDKSLVAQLQHNGTKDIEERFSWKDLITRMKTHFDL